MLESAIQRQIMDYLTARRIFHWRAQPTPIPIRRGPKIVGLRAVPSNLKGMPDLMGLYRGRMFAIEVKTQTGKQTPEQRHWQVNLNTNGGYYAVARSLEDVEALLAKIDMV